MDFLKEVIKKVGDEYASLAANIKENEEYIDTGSYILNALVSGSLFGGISKNKITALAAPESCGKTFIALSVVNNFLKENPEGMCVYFDTESAITKKLLESKGIDTKRVVVMNVVTVEEFRSKALQIVDIYSKRPEEERHPLILVLDSLGMLSTNHEINTTLEGKDTRDMSKAQLTKGAFRMLTLKLGEVGVPMIVNNHLYKTMSLYSSDEMSSGSGLKYSASTILYISKSKEKEGTNVVGVLLRFKTVKSRLSRENRDVQVRLFYDERGLDRYYGLFELGLESGVIKRENLRTYSFEGKKFSKADIVDNPETFFTQEVLEKINEYAQQKFCYGSTLVCEEDLTDEDVNGEE